MKHFITYILLFFFAICKGQQYSFPVYFEDAKGNKDTLLIGFDVEATHGVDENFGEINLLGKKLDTVFNVVFSDKNFKPNEDHNTETPMTYQLKKQILPRVDTLDNNYTLSSVVEIDVTCDNWPIKISWDSTLLKDDFFYNMILTANHHPGGWFDVSPLSGNGALHKMMNESSVVFSKEDLCVVDWRDSTLFFYMGWFDLISSTSKLLKNDVVAIYPNPFSQKMTVKLSNQKSIDAVEIINMLGVKLLEVTAISKEEIELDLSELNAGVYQIRIVNKDGTSLFSTIQKN